MKMRKFVSFAGAFALSILGSLGSAKATVFDFSYTSVPTVFFTATPLSINGSFSGVENTPGSYTFDDAFGNAIVNNQYTSVFSGGFGNYSQQGPLQLAFDPLGSSGFISGSSQSGTAIAGYAGLFTSGNLTVTQESSVLGTPGPIAGAGLVPLLGLAGAYLFGRKRIAA